MNIEKYIKNQGSKSEYNNNQSRKEAGIGGSDV